MESRIVISGIGAVTPIGLSYEEMWSAQSQGVNGVDCDQQFKEMAGYDSVTARVCGFDPKEMIDGKGLRNLDASALYLLAASKQALECAHLNVDEEMTDRVGVVTGTTFSHLQPIVVFDKEVFDDGIDFVNPALFPATVVNAASSQVSIRFNIQGFNTTVSTGYTSGLEAVRYAQQAINQGKADIVLAGAVDTLSFPLFTGFYRLGYMAGINGLPLSCPFDLRRNNPVLGEAATSLCLETEDHAISRGLYPFARVGAVASTYSAVQAGKVGTGVKGLETVVCSVLDEAGISVKDVDYISSCANSSQELDKAEVSVLKKVFGKTLKKIPVSSVKSMVGETFSAASGIQIVSCIGAMEQGVVPPTINYVERDPACDIDCVANKAQRKDVKWALTTSFGPGGYSSACLLQRYS